MHGNSIGLFVISSWVEDLKYCVLAKRNCVRIMFVFIPVCLNCHTYFAAPITKAGLGGATTIMGILATRKIAKQFALKVAARRAERGGLFGYGSGARHAQRAMQVEPTYRMQPKKIFNSDSVQRLMQDIIDSRMQGFKYNATRGNLMSKILTDEIKDKVKSLNFERYKLICLVTLGESRDQSMMSSSLCCWDPSVDRHATYSWHEAGVYCTATVYAIYHE